MAAIVTAAFSAITSAVSAAAPAAASAGSAAGSAGFSLGNILSFGQAGLGLVSTMAAIREGQSKAASLRLQAEDAKFDAQNERIQSTLRQDSMRRDLIRKVAEQDVAYAASGIDLSFGTPTEARESAAEDTYRAMAREGNNANARAMRQARRGRQLLMAADEAENAGLFKGLGAAGSSILSIVRRG